MYHLLLEAVRTILSPPYCAYCRIILPHRTPLCTDCRAHITPVVPYKLSITDHTTMSVIAYGTYEGPLAQLIRAKERGNLVGTQQLGALVAEYTATCIMPADLMIPIPMHWIRYARRGYNQAAVIAQSIHAVNHVPVAHLLRKTMYTPPQKSYNAQERKGNVAGSFALIDHTAVSQNLHIVLVDDVMTTGETLRDAARALLPLKPASLRALVAARVI